MQKQSQTHKDINTRRPCHTETDPKKQLGDHTRRARTGRPREKKKRKRLTTETVKGAWKRNVRCEREKTGEERTALTLKSVDNIERCDGLSLGVLSVCDGVTDDTLEEGLEDTTGLLVDHGGDTLDTTTASETADSGLGDTLDVVAQDLAVTLGATLSKTLSTLATASHLDRLEIEC
jgi:hypothetical protein